MKLKQQPADFRVEEVLSDGYLRERGRHRVYHVTKRKRTSIEAARILGDLAGVPAGSVAMAGLKDRQGVTRQYMSIAKGKAVRFKDDEITIEDAGFADRELSSKESAGNAFRIVVRDLTERESRRLFAALDSVREHGLPNYFDEQRFGNLRHNQGWIARDLAVGRTEQALRRLLTGVSDHDRADIKTFKSALYRKWGDWRTCRDLAGRFGRHHSIFEHLRRSPDDFAGAFRHVASRERLIHLYAWQSHVWNRAVAMHVDRSVPATARFTIRAREGKLLFPKGELPCPAEWEGALPLPGGRLQGVALADQRQLFADVLAADDMAPADFVIDGVPGFVLKPEPRPLVVRPAELRVRPTESDPMNRGRQLAKISFRLPRGAYATLVVRRLIGPPRSG